MTQSQNPLTGAHRGRRISANQNACQKVPVRRQQTHMFELKPDFEEVLNRYEAWWQCEILDRPLVSIPFPKPETEGILPMPQKSHVTARERWMDAEHVVATAEASIQNTVHFADSLPIAWPNLGPEVFSAFYGCEMEYGESTAWSKPILPDWTAGSLAKLRIDENNFYFHKLMEMTDALIQAARGRFIVGYTDLHGGGDAIAAFRDPQELLIDTLEHPEEIKSLCDRITTDFLRVYDMFHERLSVAGMPSTTWCPATCKGKFHVPSNDFSFMISEDAFEQLFIPGIMRECQHMDRCIYHLDGPQALRHLDRLLEIPEIHAIQWVPGAGHDYWADWVDVYQRIQNKNRALQILSVPARDLHLLFGALHPEGVWISSVSGIRDREEAATALRQIEQWTTKQ